MYEAHATSDDTMLFRPGKSFSQAKLDDLTQQLERSRSKDWQPCL
jgi:hypothetical protein